MIDLLISLLGSSISLVFKLSVIWFPLILLYIFCILWVRYARMHFLHSLEWDLLEIRVPQEVSKSPIAMETFLSFLYQTGGEKKFKDKYIKGSVRPYFSLEIASIEGQVKFYIYTQKKFRNFIETGLYAQYPNIEIHDAPDYTRSIHFDEKNTEMFTTEYKLSQPDPYPIKTYIDYGIENTAVKEEFKTDPINTIIEFMGSIGANQQCWMQIVIRAHKKDYKEGIFSEPIDLWKKQAKDEIKKIKEGTVTKEGESSFANPTKGDMEKIYALEKSVSKLSFDTGIRVVYWGKKGFFNSANKSGVSALLRAYSSPNLNSFETENDEDNDPQGLLAYKSRSFLYYPIIGKKIVLNVEELASIFHLPGQVTQTPTFARIPSRKSEAPSNLPI